MFEQIKKFLRKLNYAPPIGMHFDAILLGGASRDQRKLDEKSKVARAHLENIKE